MAKYQKDDDFLRERVRGFVAQRNYEYDVTNYDEETGKKWIPEDAMTQEEWKEMIVKKFKDYTKNSLYAYFIFHDKDYLPDGSYKPLHVHIVIRFENPRYIGSVMKALGVSDIRNIEKAKSYKSSLAYLLHITSQARKDGKHVYDQENLYMCGKEIDEEHKYPYEHYDNIVAEKNESSKEETEAQTIAIKTAKKMLEKIRDIGITLKEARSIIKDSVEKSFSYVAEDVYYNYQSKFKAAEVDYFEDLIEKLKEEGRNLLVCYIEGAGLSGKSKLAEALAFRLQTGRGVHIAAAPGKNKTPDFVSKYKYQNVSVINEVRGTTFGTREFMDNFDNEIYAPLSSRNDDVDWGADHVFMTSSRNVFEFRNECFRFNEGGSDLVDVNFETGETRIKREHAPMDEAFQFTRRITHRIKIENINDDKKLISVYCFDMAKKGFRLQKNIITIPLFDKDKYEFERIVRLIVECFKNKDMDVLDGEVVQDDDLEQNPEDVYEYEEPSKKREFLWTSPSCKINKTYKIEKEQEMLMNYDNEEATKNINQHKEFNDRLGITPTDIGQHIRKRNEIKGTPLDV
ncbi:replication protein [Staphylococcus pettenkoferi]|uniref:Rep family protein n=1 Tax=Staphylococcus pettenkoferi TaxID=170573 RepID=UPI0022752FDC|nr:Rep family protein [Staphylococcus pettenkoferi]MCY1567448.1 replication protein [Staphylococcus pettenkoferi]